MAVNDALGLGITVLKTVLVKLMTISRNVIGVFYNLLISLFFTDHIVLDNKAHL